MATSPQGTFEVIARLLARLFSPLEHRLTSSQITVLLAELGLQFPPAFATDAGIVSSTSEVVDGLRAIPGLVSDLEAAIEAEDIAQIVSKGLALANAIRVGIQGMETIANAIRTAGASAGISAAELNQFCDELPSRLIDYLVIKNLEAISGLSDALQFFGVVERTDVPAVDAQHPAFTRRVLHLDQIPNVIQSPTQQLQTLYNWGAPTFDGVHLLQTVQKLLTQAGVPAILDTSGAVPVLDAMFLEVSPKKDISPPGLLLKVADTVNIDTSTPYQQDNWQLVLTLNTDIAVGAQVVVQPGDAVTFVPPAGQVQGDESLQWTAGTPSGPPYLILGEAAGSRLQAQQLIAKAGVGFSWNSATNSGRGNFKISGQVIHGKIAVNLDDADGFLSDLFAGTALESDFALSLAFSTQSGLTFEGSGSLQVQVPIHVSLGPVDLSALTFTVGLQNGTVPIAAAADISASLGPLQASVQQIGIQANLTVPADHKGNLGPLDFSLSFKPPNGVGLSVDAGVIKGGGFLYIDTARGEYAGAMQLVFADFLGLQAIGLITTKMPDGSSGFSLLIIITVDFGAGIQLGFGFTLLAVGGLLGLNRSMLFQPLMDGIRTDAIESVMFPQDVVANASRIISDLRAIFPPQQGTFLIGPMAKLGWGEPTLISLSLGVIVEIPPGDIAILGVLKLALPADDVAILLLQVNFAGALEFDKQRLYFFASLYDSHILFITLEGDMGLLMAWGDNANFVVSIGGFNPQFNPPPLPFPAPRRIEVDIINESYARIRCDGYFAVTSNTVQFGTHSEYFFGFSALNLSGSSGFDALIQFSPFQFSVSISMSFNVNVFGIGVYGIDMDLALSGPTPWHVHGTASISFLFFSVGIGVDFTWGDNRNTMLPPIAVMPVLSGEYGKQSNWKAVLPSGSNLLVALRQLSAAESAMVLHPVGTLQVSQRAVPIDLTLDKDGNQQPSDANYFTLDVTSGGLSKLHTLQEQFAPGQFKNMDDATKLSQPAYVPLDSGIELAAAGNAYASGTAITRNVRYELTVIDTKLRRVVNRFFTYVGSMFVHFLAGSSVTRAAFSSRTAGQEQPYKDHVTVGAETFAVALVSNNTVYSPAAASFTSQAAALDHLNRAVANDPTLSGTLHVLPQFEVAA